jgi:hypothetical protein
MDGFCRGFTVNVVFCLRVPRLFSSKTFGELISYELVRRNASNLSNVRARIVGRFEKGEVLDEPSLKLRLFVQGFDG